jgi:hypothetical protein
VKFKLSVVIIALLLGGVLVVFVIKGTLMREGYDTWVDVRNYGSAMVR